LRAFVVGVPDNQLGARDVQDFVRAHVARHKVPRDVIFVDALPGNETGKVLKGQLARD
jgi:fatty-acyl-CoA synthase